MCQTLLPGTPCLAALTNGQQEDVVEDKAERALARKAQLERDAVPQPARQSMEFPGGKGVGAQRRERCSLGEAKGKGAVGGKHVVAVPGGRAAATVLGTYGRLHARAG